MRMTNKTEVDSPWNWTDILSRMSRVLSSSDLASVNKTAQLFAGPFVILVSTILSLRTRDEVTFSRSLALLSRAPDPSSLLALSIEELETLVYPSAFFRVKAKNLRKICRIVLDSPKKQVPSSWEGLLALPGVGRKTAALVLGLGFGIPAICVDIHVHRISNRLGLVSTRTPEETEKALENQVPKGLWIKLNEIMVRFGQQICTPQSPRCSICPFTDKCPRSGVTRTR